jgi:class 3 adenylate cyclase
MKNDSSIVERVLSLLRQYGWETGYKKLEAQLRAEGRADDGNEVREFFLGWMAAERGNFTEAIRQFRAAAEVPPLVGWALLGEAFVALRGKAHSDAMRLLAEARNHCTDDPQLLATIFHVEGASLFHQGASDEAIPLLTEAIRLYGPQHFGFGRVLDTFGAIYASRDNFQCAREFFDQALALKHPEDLTGRAVTHGQLGRLYLDWGYHDKAQHHFDEDLKISRQIGDDFGKAIMCNFLGQVCLMRGEQEMAVNRSSVARRELDTAAGWLESAGSLSLAKKWPIIEGYARKDQARLALAQGNADLAATHVKAADDIFRSRGFREGLAHVNRVWGMLHSAQGRWEEAQTSYQAALRQFQETRQSAEVARTLFAIARACAAAGEARPLVSSAFLEALSAAESCRRAHLVRQIEDDLKLHDPALYCDRIYRRVRGRAVLEDAVSLIDGTREPATVLFLDLQGSTELFRFRDPGEMLMTLNEMMTNFSAVLRKYEAQVNGFRGDGFLALVRGPQDAVRGVDAALELYEAMAVFNKPREILGLPPWIARIGVNSGEVFLGNVGTYDKLDFSAIGHTVNLGARLEGVAEAGMPCISRGTYEKVQHQFRFARNSPRTVAMKGLGPTEVWDVVGRISTAPAETSVQPEGRAISPKSLSTNLSESAGPSELNGGDSRFFPQTADVGRFVFRRLNPTMWEFAFGSDKTASVGKHLVGFEYLAMLVGEPDREIRPMELLSRGGGRKRGQATSADDHPVGSLADESAAEADRAMGNDDRLDDRAIKEYRRRVAQLRKELQSSEDPRKRSELEFIESQLRSATGLGGKRAAVGSNRLKLDYNAVKKAVDTALSVLQGHALVDLAAHLSTHIELSVKSCRYRNSARLQWDAAYST